jgi:hypothetical protein
MSALGQKRTSRDSFDHLVGTGEHRRWNCEAQRLSGLKIDHHLVFGRLLHGQLVWLGAFQDFVDVGGSASMEVCKVGGVA